MLILIVFLLTYIRSDIIWKVFEIKYHLFELFFRMSFPRRSGQDRKMGVLCDILLVFFLFYFLSSLYEVLASIVRQRIVVF